MTDYDCGSRTRLFGGHYGDLEKLIEQFFSGGQFMSELNVTDLAVAKLKEYMQANNIVSALRVALMQGG